MIINKFEIDQISVEWDCSTEIAQAILELADGDRELADRIWDDPTPEEVRRVIDRAWELVDDAVDELYWGGTISRGTDGDAVVREMWGDLLKREAE